MASISAALSAKSETARTRILGSSSVGASLPGLSVVTRSSTRPSHRCAASSGSSSSSHWRMTPPQIPYRPMPRTSGSAFGQLARSGGFCQRQIMPQTARGAMTGLSQSAVLGGSGRPYRAWFRLRHRPQAPRSKAPDSSHSARARSSARSMSTSHAASVAASAPARMQNGRCWKRWVGAAWEPGGLCGGCLEFWGAPPALAPLHGTVDRSMRLESDVIAPACHQKKIPPPGNTRRAGSRMSESATKRHPRQQLRWRSLGVKLLRNTERFEKKAVEQHPQ